jgi:hypothetical protein
MGLNRDEIARHKRVVVRQEGDHVHEEHFVEDIGLENRQMVYKSTQLVWLIFGLLEALIGFRIIHIRVAIPKHNRKSLHPEFRFGIDISHRDVGLCVCRLGDYPPDLGGFLPPDNRSGNHI